jgi:hypothetical protein
METLLRHHIEETTRRFTEIREDIKEVRDSVQDGLKGVDEKLAELATFKTQIMTQTKVVSAIWGASWGFVTLVVGLVLKKYIS